MEPAYIPVQSMPVIGAAVASGADSRCPPGWSLDTRGGDGRMLIVSRETLCAIDVFPEDDPTEGDACFVFPFRPVQHPSHA